MHPTIPALFLLAAFSSGKSIPLYGELCVDGVFVDNTCYRLPYRTGPTINYQQASDLCQFHGGALAEIPSQEVYHAVFRYVQRSWYYEQNVDRVQVWIGAELNMGDQNVYLVSGGKSYLAWFPGYPNSRTNHVKIALVVPTKPTRPLRANGMFNIVATHLAIPLCQFRFN